MADSSYRPRPQSSSGPRRKATPPSPIKLTSSASFSCIPLLASRPSGSSPPAVTSAVAFGSTSTTPSPGAFSIGLASGMQRSRRGSGATSEGENSHTPSERSYSSFPWGYFYDQPDSSASVLENIVNSMPSSSTELADTLSLSRQPPISSHSSLPHIRSDPSSSMRQSRNPARTSHGGKQLRLTLPPPQVLDMFGVAIQSGLLGKGTDNEGHGTGLHDQQRLRQSLLGIAFPTTPDTSLNNMPVLCAGSGRDGRGLGSAEAGMAIGHEIMVGGATAALLAANPHLAPGGLALLTPPDDNGVIEWRREETSNEATAPASMQAARRPQSICERFGNVGSEPVTNSSDIPGKRVGGLRKLEDLRLSVITPSARRNENEPAETGGKDRTAKQEGANEKEDPTVNKPAKDDKDSPGFPTFVEDGWLGNAMAILFDSPFSVQISSEAVRMLSYSLPCPLPSTNATDQSTVTSTSTNSSMLPASAASAPAVAAAAGQPFSPSLAARCHSKVKERSGSSTPTGLIGVEDGVTTALHTLTNGIQRRYSNDESKRVYIHVSHAISPHIPLNRLPSTPSMGSCGFGGSFDGPSAGGAGGYFSPSVFNSIVVAPGSSTSTPGAGILSVSTSSPNPILPPSSLHLTLLERYIPPTSRQEDEDMFSPTSSIFLDRLFELSPSGGSLVFIYPTKTGAKDFDKQYLGPILDPLLRKLMVLYMLREDLLWGIRNMAAIDGMKEFDGLKWELQKICRRLSSKGSGQGGSNRFPGRPNTVFRLVHASKENIPLNDNSWREWWTQQEQQRIREAVKRHFSNLQPPGERGAPTTPTSPKPKSPGRASSSRGPPSISQSAKLPPSSPGRAFSSRGPPSMSQSAKLPPPSPTSAGFDTTPTSSSTVYSFGYGAPGDLAREVLDGVRAPTVRPSSRGMSEAVVASAMSGTTSLGVGGVVGDFDTAGDGIFHGGRKVKERGIEVGVFVLRREYVS